ncbi:putative bifunctional diguanylate cyclase/phosphodiesterase [Micromonospora sp. NPDC048871]|uniref:putative bifunctional diguanylate cyclase/phosphodiesterase n=1 Tax=unclassified Micromonospora TaxID=2617518 RepID=UPI002E109405|nr:EAL domain-containing protein [Micromonospora sp. NBC_01739]
MDIEQAPAGSAGQSRSARVGVLAAGAVVAVETIWLALALPGAALVSDLGALIVAGWAALACVGAARRHPRPLRRFWLLLAATMLLSVAGRALWTVQRLAGQELPHTLPVGLIFTASLLTGTVAVLCALTAPRTSLGRALALLDGLIVGLALIPIGWLLLFRNVALVADAMYVSWMAAGTYQTGTLVDVLWPLSYLLIGAATLLPAPQRCDQGEEASEAPLPPWWRVTLPYLPVGGVIVAALLARDVSGHSPLPVFLALLALLAALAVRQILAANENLRLVGRLRQLAYVDQLTGLPNRLAFIRRLRSALGGAQPVAVLLLDLDGFKQVNDRFGHTTGDNLLTGLSSRMRGAVADDGLIARIGGDEFAVLVTGRAATPEGLAERLLASLHPSAGEEVVGVHPSASIGIAEYGPQHESYTDLLRDADIAMYAAKAAGKSAYRRCTPALRESAVSRAELIADLRRAVDEQQLHLEFQPIVDLATGTVRSAEALVRWRHPRLGTLSPGRFLPLAEETGLILPIDRWVIQEACRAAATWQDRVPAATVAVNIAASHLRRPDLIATVTEATAGAGLAPRALTLELTESALIEGSEAVLDRLSQLRELGIRIAIDDFGTGYSSLSYLHRIPATELKIDRSFVARLSEDTRAYATVEMVTRLAGAYGLGVVAEGVETERQHDAVAAIGCVQGQGYRYGRPAALDELRTVLARCGPAPVADVAESDLTLT